MWTYASLGLYQTVPFLLELATLDISISLQHNHTALEHVCIVSLKMSHFPNNVIFVFCFVFTSICFQWSLTIESQTYRIIQYAPKL